MSSRGKMLVQLALEAMRNTQEDVALTDGFLSYPMGPGSVPTPASAEGNLPSYLEMPIIDVPTADFDILHSHEDECSSFQTVISDISEVNAVFNSDMKQCDKQTAHILPSDVLSANGNEDIDDGILPVLVLPRSETEVNALFNSDMKQCDKQTAHILPSDVLPANGNEDIDDGILPVLVLPRSENEVNAVTEVNSGNIRSSNEDKLEGSEASEQNCEQKTSRKKNTDMNKILRLHGKKYQGRKYTGNKCYDVVEREERKLLPVTCSHKQGKQLIRERSFMCSEIDENQRSRIHQTIWEFSSWDEKKAYVYGLVNFRTTIRRRVSRINEELPKKMHGYDCYLPTEAGKKVRVCKNFFLATTGLKKDVFDEWVKPFYLCNHNDKANIGETNKRRNSGQHEDTSSSKKFKSNSVKQWLEIIPKVPSHYCRSSSNRVYVEPDFKSVSNMHDIYKLWCQENGTNYVQRKRFSEILEEEKISVFKPRKDQCDTCVAFKEGNVTEDVFNIHIKKKEEARKAKENAEASMTESTLVLTMDVQSVLLCPKLLVSKQYYSQKLQIHNFSIYVKNTKDVHLYFWHEGEGKVSANEFTSCIIDFLENETCTARKVFLISDGCQYQNKNKVLVSALSDVSTKLNIEIEQIILEKGHTMMEVDSVHSTLDRLFTPPIYSPAHYVSKIEAARKSQPYKIHYLDHTFFKDYEHVSSNFTSIRPGKKKGDPTVTDIRGLLFKEGEVFYKIYHSDKWQILPQRRQKQSQSEVQQLYKEPVKIEKSKYDSLQGLKRFIHKDYHYFYDDLKY